MTGKTCVTELNEILLNCLPNSCSNQVYVQGFYCKSITLKKSSNMFERMEITESIYKGVVEPSYKKPTRSDANCAGHSKHNRREAASSWIR